MLTKRVLSAAVLIPIAAATIYLGGLATLALAAVFGLLATYEYLTLLRHQGWTPSYALGLGFVAFLLVDAAWPALGFLPWGLALFPLLALTVEVFHGNEPGSLVRWALLVSGSLYIGYSVGYLMRLRALDQGIAWIALALMGTWICDSAAYFVGRRWGKRPFFQKISPKKTQEGALGGLVGGVIAVVVLGWLLLGLPLGWGALLGVLLVIAATFGDLAESVIKRQVGVKDSSQLIPGHGGFLDRIDSLLFVIPVVYYFALVLEALAR